MAFLDSFEPYEQRGIVVALLIGIFLSIAFYNVLELTVSIFTSFKRYTGLYFWSLLVATWGIAFNGTGYLLQHLSLTDLKNLYATLILIGWCSMVTGQSVVLYSRLHIVMHNQKHLRLVLYMIIINALWLHPPIIVLVYGGNSGNPEPFHRGYLVYEKIQLSVFFVQELIISSLYVWETTKRLRLEESIGHMRTRQIMNHLIWVNVLVALLDVTILALEFTNLTNIQTAWKPLAYSIKLKLEFSILSQLVNLRHGGATSNSSFHTRSQRRGYAGNDMAMEPFSGGRSTHLTAADEPEYEIRIGKGESRDSTLAPHAFPTKTTEITIHTQTRPGHVPRDSDDNSENMSKEREGDVCSTSSEVHFARQ
ncbi:hypothetical protein DHEL01_v211439 [Diaporthe helianthi]|uniref:DUF7703 domain-containing protein n=1 Tax=Diaporthe helianthi TaxID=158607 RepID=A0A2P5HIU7_DIAHE|nr:hypothetical protein DHEL01_v211439 [Diaporthe helianthi]